MDTALTPMCGGSPVLVRVVRSARNLAAKVHRHISPSGEVEQAEHVLRAWLLMRQAVGDRDRFNAHIRPRQKERQRHQIVVSGVGIHDHGTRGGLRGSRGCEEEVA